MPIDPRLASLMGLLPQMAPPMQQPPMAPPMAPGVQQPQFPTPPPQQSLWSRIQGGLFPDASGGLLGEEAMGGLRRQGLLEAGLAMLANSGESTERRGLGQILAQGLQQGRQSYMGGLGSALQQQQLMAEMAAQRKKQLSLERIAEQFKPVPGETADARRERLAGYVGELIRLDPENAGKYNTLGGLLEPPKAAAPVRGTMVETTGGQQLVNPITGEVIAKYGPKPKPPKADSGGKPPTASQEIVGGFAHRMINAERLISDLEEGGVSLPDEVLIFSPTSKKGMAAYATLDAAQQKYVTIMSDWVAAKLRRESGAVINDDEWVREGRTYFRAFRDKPEVGPTKRQLRRTANYSVVQQAGRAYELPKEYGDLVDDGRRKTPRKTPTRVIPGLEDIP